MAQEKTTERMLLLRARAGDNVALEELLNSYRPMVNRIARGYFLNNGDEDDLSQEGMIGLYKAIRDFDESKQVNFYSFAVLCITRQIHTAIKSANRQKHIPLNSSLSLDRAVYEENVSKISGLSSDRVIAAMQSEQKETETPVIPEKENKTDTTENNLLKAAEYFVLSAMIYGKSYVNFGDTKIEYFTDPDLVKIFEYITECAKSNKIPVASHVYDLVGKEIADQIIDAIEAIRSENQASYYKQCLETIYKTYKTKEIKNLANAINAETDDEKKKELKKKLLELSKK